MDKYVRGKVLGKGSFGVCSIVTRKSDGKSFVVKEIDVSRMPKAERETAELEAKLLMALNHPNIVRCVECFVANSKLCIVMDYCSEGDLYGLLQKRRGVPLPEDTILDWFVQLCLSLKHVHDRKILHRDIKTQNVFVSSGGLLKLGDFGVSKVLNSTWQLAATAVGTPYYLSPEICQNKRYNQKSDIWSLGCVLYEITAGRHAFEAPNMRALIQKIVKGTYNPVPSTRSKELRDLIDRIFTLNWEKRPSINDILATPIVKARITKFLSATLQEHEFSHTIIHGRPKPGQLVVQPKQDSSSVPALPPPAFPSAQAKAPSPAVPQRASPSVQAPPVRRSSQPANPAPPVRRSNPPVQGLAAAKSPNPSAYSPKPGGVRAAAPSASPLMHAPSPGRPPSSPPSAAKPSSRPSSGGAGSRASSAGTRASQPQPNAAQAANQRAAQIAAAAQKGVRPPTPDAPPVAAQHRFGGEAAVRRSRELAAIQAQREVERLKLEEQRKKIEADRARLNSERRKAEAAREEKARKAAAEEEQRRKAAAVEMQRKREAERQRKKIEDEQKRKEAEKAVREKERSDMHAKMAAQKKEYYERQQQAARNRAAAEEEARGPAAAAAAAGKVDGALERKSPPVEVFEKPRQRKQWQSSETPPDVSPRGGSPDGDGEAPPGRKEDKGAGAGEALTPEARRAVWEEMRAGVERNKRAAAEERRGGGLAAFLGVPAESQDGGKPAAGAPARSNADAARPSSPGITAEATLAPAADPYERRRCKLEAEAQAREAEIQAFQRQHWQEMKGAAARNRAALLAEMRNGGGSLNPDPLSPGKPLPPIPSKQQQEDQGQENEGEQQAEGERQQGSSGSPREEDFEFAAMLKDMQDVLVHEGESEPSQGEEDDELYNDGKYASALSGRFMLNGEEVPLPVNESDSLAMKVEALRMFLEQQLDTMPFLRVYRRLESLSVEDDEEEVSHEFLEALGPEKLPYLQLIHQLIVCEVNLNCEQAT
ncbi:kinase-like domain-containing protein [Dunaliella salina]|uniref:non-specific serine/threonine protein kinase n=1 Tax=Dunaliella salina TaxID=3046 RepID=A0ABQ7GY22_DUNSA|nr:kinase-like domain-containing protein [Dunaliella salina]|eukprot:KAF5839493.1 kinase-like domain-containing protein [Dunaliella salina]